MRKRVICFAGWPFGQYPHAKVPWDDVYLRWKGKPGRRIYHAAPCLECVAEIHAELQMHEDIRNREDEDYLAAVDSMFRRTHRASKEERQTWYRDEDAKYQRLLAELDTQEYACYGEGAGLHIVTKANGIDRWEAERMLAWWLKTAENIRNAKFVWDAPDYVITPTGFGNYSSETRD